MTITNGTRPSVVKQISAPVSYTEAKRRRDTIHSPLVAISEAIGFSRELLHRRGPWDETRRNPDEYEPYRPYTKEDEMLLDLVTTTADRGSEEEQIAVRNAVIHYFNTRCLLTLEPLGAPRCTDLVGLTLSSKKEVHEAEAATIRAITSKCPQAFETATREHTEALTMMEQLRSALHSWSHWAHLRVMQ